MYLDDKSSSQTQHCSKATYNLNSYILALLQLLYAFNIIQKTPNNSAVLQAEEDGENVGPHLLLN